MDTVSFDQFPLSEDQIKDALPFLVEETTVDVIFFEEQPIAIDMPITVDLEVKDAPPGHRGDTAQGGTKPVTLVTGHVVQVPLFVSEGEKVKIDTRTGDYLSRA